MKPKNLILALSIIFILNACSGNSKIDRYSLVNRHNITHSSKDILNSLSVGNGEFAFTVDITGLQTLPLRYQDGVPLGTMSNWAWGSFPNPQNYKLDDVVRYYTVGDREIPYYYQFTGDSNNRQVEATDWLRENPHRLHLGLVGLEIVKSDGTPITIDDVDNPKQHQNLWTGIITSRFEIEGVEVIVKTLCDQTNDRIAVNIESELIDNGQLTVSIKFPYSRHEKFNPGHGLSRADEHQSKIIQNTDNQATVYRNTAGKEYYANINWAEPAALTKQASHHYSIEPNSNSSNLTFGVLFTPEQTEQTFSFEKVVKDNKIAWEDFWSNGGAVDFSACTDPRAIELERRVVLSQYLTKIQCSGTLPPQETGLTYNSWHGKFHLEMHWWHGLHFILWQRSHLIEEQMEFYYSILDKATQMAQLQGYAGARWQKMIDPSGRESPSSIGVFLIWQQPHIIYFADLLYQTSNKSPEVLKRYAPLVEVTANFMASYARYDSLRSEYILGPTLIPAQERFAPEETINPAFELAYWHWGLQTAQEWRELTGQEPNSEWQHVIENLSPLPQKDGLYLFTETAPDSYSNQTYLTDHPMVLGLLGMLPDGPMVDIATMNSTLDAILDKWNWETCWGWDFPMAAMNATALNRPERAIDLLLMETVKNTYLLNGHNYQDDNLSLYLPGNGGLLTTVAMMCTHSAPDGSNGFPADGTWKVQFENLNQMHY